MKNLASWLWIKLKAFVEIFANLIVLLFLIPFACLFWITDLYHWVDRALDPKDRKEWRWD